MSVTREARYLAGNDIGKTIAYTKDIGAGYGEHITGTLWGLTHHTLGKHHITIAFLDIGPDPTGASRILYLKPADHITITGTPSPPTTRQGTKPTFVAFDEMSTTPPPVSVADLYSLGDELQANLDRHAETSTP